MTTNKPRPTDTHTVRYQGARGPVVEYIELRSGSQVRGMQEAAETHRRAGDATASVRPLPRLYGRSI